MGRCEDGFASGRIARVGALVLGAFALAACSSSSPGRLGSNVDPRYGVSASPRVVEPGEPVPKGGGTYRVGRPYMVAGRMYYPQENTRYRSEGLASWYGEDFHGRLTANGEVYDMNSLSAAHPTLPMPSYVRVTHLTNQRSVIVRINDRGPYHGNREIDLSGKAAELLGFRDHGLARVRVEYVAPAPLEGSDDRRLLATLREGTPAPAPSGVMLASARPFVPEVAGRSALVGRPVPVPADRPFDLGGRDGREAAISTTGVAVAARHPGSRDRDAAEARLQWTPGPAPAPPAVSAYAPVRPDPAAVTTGRGLY